VDTSVVVLAPTPPEIESDAGNGNPPGPTAPLIVGGGADIRYRLENGQHPQLFRTGDSLKPVLYSALIPLDLDGFDRLRSVHRLLAALHGRAVPSDTRLTLQQRTRARCMLQAFDGRRCGATQQQIAQAIFHTDRMGRTEWQESSTRYAVMSMLRDARGMVAGGYRKLLRHDRKAR